MPTGGIITIAASPDFERKMVRIDVSDTGVGFAPEVLVRAMEPYYSTKEVNEGMGLGLAMAKGFVEQSGGALDIQTEQGVGTTVSLWMPMSSRSRKHVTGLIVPPLRLLYIGAAMIIVTYARARRAARRPSPRPSLSRRSSPRSAASRPG